MRNSRKAHSGCSKGLSHGQELTDNTWAQCTRLACHATSQQFKYMQDLYVGCMQIQLAEQALMAHSAT